MQGNNIWVTYLITFICGVIVGLLMLIPTCKTPKKEIIQNYDTVYIDEERVINNTITINKRDTIVKIDSLFITEYDTLVIIPISDYLYRDTLVFKDSAYLDLSVYHSGYLSKIQKLEFNYTSPPKQAEKKRIHPFIGISAGPIIDYSFTSVNGAAIELDAGLIFKNNWGGKIGYELDAFSTGMNHSLKIGIIKQF